MQWFRRHDRGRPPHPDVLTPAEWRVLQHVREGLPNAEIAVRLGISVNTVRAHVSNMLAKLELPDRQALAAWQGEPSEASLRALTRTRLALPFAAWSTAARVIAVGGVATASAVLVWVAIGVTSDGGASGEVGTAAETEPEPASQEARPPLGPPPRCDLALPDDFGTVSNEQLRQEGLYEVGEFITPQACELLVSNRSDRAVLWLADGGELRYEVLPITPREVDIQDVMPLQVAGFALLTDRGALHLDVNLAAGNFSVDWYEIASERIGATVIDRIGPEGTFLILYARDPAAGASHRVAVSTDGTLFVDLQPIPDSAAIVSATGEPIALENLELLRYRDAVGGTGATTCDIERSSCAVLFFPDELLRAPVAGTVRCPTDDELEYDRYGTIQLPRWLPAGPTVLLASDFTLEYRWLHGRAGGSSTFHCASGDVLPGDTLSVHNHFRISAWSPDGQPLSVVIARDNTLYIGEVDVRLGCPCQGGR